jgi:membrane-associated phospholipid phosphatase
VSATGEALQQLITEVITEVDTAEIACWAVGLSAALLVVSTLVPGWLRGRGDARADAWSFAVLRWLAVVVPLVVLTQQVLHSGWLTGADAATLGWFTAHRSTGETTAAVAVTTAGGPAGVAIIGLLASAIWVWRRRSPWPAVVVMGTLAVVAAANSLCKLAVGRHRPPVSAHLVAETDLSYPSGHVAGTVALAGAVLLLYLPAARTWLRRGVAVVAAVLVVSAVAVSRLYLGVHWLTDVVGAALLGTEVVLAAGAVLAAAPVADTAAHEQEHPVLALRPG